METVRNILVNENQRRSIVTSLAMLDEALCLFEEYGRGREIHSIYYHESNRLSVRQRKRLLAEIERARKLMQQTKTALDLSVKVENVAKRIWGHSAGFWEMLTEMESKRLRGYGEVAPALAEYLDPMVKKLLAQMQQISGVASELVAREIGEDDADG